MDARKRVILALEQSGKTRQALADLLGVGRGAVSDMLNKEGRELDSIKYLEATAALTGCRFEWLRTGLGPMMETTQGTTSKKDCDDEVMEALQQLRQRVDDIEDKVGKGDGGQ